MTSRLSRRLRRADWITAGRWLVAALVLVSAEGCSHPRSQQLAKASSSEKALAAPAAPAAPELLPPRFRVFHIFPKETGIWSVGEPLIACESHCIFEWAKDPVPRTWLITADGIELDATLLPQVKHLERPVIRYWGNYPKELYALIEVDHDSSDQRDLAFRYLGRRPAKHFVFTDTPSGSSAEAVVSRGFSLPKSDCGEHRAQFQAFDAEELAAWQRQYGSDGAGPVRSALRLCGYGGPLLVVDELKLAVWSGQRWERRPAPWHLVEPFGALRLSNGATLVRSLDNPYEGVRSIFWVSPSGKVAPVDLQPVTAEPALGSIRFQAPLEWHGEVWLVVETDAGTALLAPVTPSEVTRPRP